MDKVGRIIVKEGTDIRKYRELHSLNPVSYEETYLRGKPIAFQKFIRNKMSRGFNLWQSIKLWEEELRKKEKR